MSENQPSQWWRWPLMPFASVAGGLTGAALVFLIQWIGIKKAGFATDGWLVLYVLPTMSSAAFGWVYVFVSYAVAPRWKFVSGVIMTAVLCIACAAKAYTALSHHYGDLSNSIQPILASLFMAAAAVLSLIQVHGDKSMR